MDKRQLEEAIRQERVGVLVVNTRSRRGEMMFSAAAEELGRRGVVISESYPVRDPARIPWIVKDTIDRGHRLIIVGGGDGTMSSVVDFFAYRDAALGILPLGTGNSFARTLGIPLTLNGALDVITGGKVSDVDLGKVGDDYFANVATIGLSADVARGTPNSLKKRLGVLSYLWSGIRIFPGHRHFDCELIVDDTARRIRTHQIIIANGSVYGILKLAPDSNVDNRHLFVFAMDSMSRWAVFRFWAGLVTGLHTRLPESKVLLVKQMTVITDPPKHVEIDGETTTVTPVEVGIAPNALKVMTPAGFPDSD